MYLFHFAIGIARIVHKPAFKRVRTFRSLMFQEVSTNSRLERMNNNLGISILSSLEVGNTVYSTAQDISQIASVLQKRETTRS